MSVNKTTLNSIFIKRKISVMIIVAALIAFVFPIPSTHAAEDNAHFTSMEIEVICNGISAAISSSVDKDNPIYKASIGTIGEEGELTGGIMTFMKPFINIEKGVAGLIVLILALSRFIKNIDSGRDPVESVFKILIEIGVVGVFIINSTKLVGLLIQFGKALFDNLALLVPALGDLEVSFEVTTGESEFQKFVGSVLTAVAGSPVGQYIFQSITSTYLVIPFFLTIIAVIAAKFLCYQVLIEIAIRRVFTPLAICDIYGEGLRSPGVRWLKRILACWFKLMIAIVVGYVVGLANKEAVQAIFSLDLTSITSMAEQIYQIFMGFFGCIAISFCGVGMITKGGQIADEIVGV